MPVIPPPFKSSHRGASRYAPNAMQSPAPGSISAHPAYRGDRAAFTDKRLATALKVGTVDAGIPPPVPLDNGGCHGHAARWLHNVTALRLIMTSHPKTDKATKHNYHVMYHEYLAPLAERMCNTRGKLRMLEVGLGCGYMQPGGSASMFSELLSFVDFEYHVLEFDAPCAKKWAAAQSDPRLHVHIGSQNSTADLDRLYSQSGGEPFDAIVDDGPHVSEFQHTTLTHMIGRVAPNGFYAVEDIHSSCKDWIANEPGRRANPHRAPTRPPSHSETPQRSSPRLSLLCRRGWHSLVYEDFPRRGHLLQRSGGLAAAACGGALAFPKRAPR